MSKSNEIYRYAHISVSDIKGFIKLNDGYLIKAKNNNFLQ